MAETDHATGTCLCGAVHFHAKGIKRNVGACHCGMCRKWGGGPLLALDGGTDVSFTGEEHISVFSSSEWAERGFCNKCGTHLFYRLKEQNIHIIPAGLLDGDRDLVFDHQIFIEEKPSFYDFANETKNMTGAEVFAQFAPPED